MDRALFCQLKVNFGANELTERSLNFKVVHFCVCEFLFSNDIVVVLDLEFLYLRSEVKVLSIIHDLVYYVLAVMFSH